MLPDPRRYAERAPIHPLLDLADGAHHHDLVAAFRALARGSLDGEIAAALAAASSQPEYAALWHALCAAVEKPDDDIAPRVFAIPWIIVCGGNVATTIDCVLPDIGELARVLERHGVFGASRNVGLANALCAIETLEALAPSTLLNGWEDPRIRHLQPAPIHVSRGVEEVHVRFLAGAAVAPSHAPDIVETGANIGAWGTPALRAMAAQLATSDVQVLPMPRPPTGLYSATHRGRKAGLEAAFNLFMSNSVRRFRLALGDPSVMLSAHESREVRVTLWTAFDDAMIEGFRWPLHPADDLGEIERTITSMISECRLLEPEVRGSVLPDCTPTGAILFPVGSPR